MRIQEFLRAWVRASGKGGCASASQSSTVDGVDSRILILTIAVFITGLAENVFIGILPDVARGLGVTESEASVVISVFSVTYAIFAPIAALISHQFDAKPTLVIAIAIFASSNAPVVIGGSGLLLISASRIVTATACAQISICAVACAVRIVSERYRARAIAAVYLGTSSSLFLGVPLGVWITHLIGWRAVGLAMIGLSLAAISLVLLRLPNIGPRSKGLLFGRLYLAHFRDRRQMMAQCVSILFIAGHFTLFSYLTSYAASKGFSGPGWEALLYAVFGSSGVAGGMLAGTLSDLAGRRLALVASPAIYLVTTLLLCVSESSIFFFASLSLWGCASWSISPIVQSYITDLARSPNDIVIGANVTAMHIGVAGGAAVGSGLLANYDVSVLPMGAAGLAAMALATAILSVRNSHS
ncbi:MFS transporter [Rhizobium calliandrae]|uniref:MFS transporter n=1 Tax=Rhizobium calliandrae TaxID=1312182 RepID=A0ABT7KLX5_9HYPH|nr:MFS transporter [Rhizobium calliandrae]MDL2408244.1 MFS transporter [Rhizobium calliandrae]